VKVRLVVLAVSAAALAVPTNALATPNLSAQLASQSVRYGASHKMAGKLVDGTTPLAGQELVLEGRRYPYEGSYRVIGRGTTDADGRFRFRPKLDRNHLLRVVAPVQRLTSETEHAYTLPSFSLSYRAVAPGVARLLQRYTVPKGVKLTAPTHFYLGRQGAKWSTKAMTGRTKRTASGRYRSTVRVKLPMSWHGRFRFGSCFRTSQGSGMGDPKATCPKVRLRF
jgi:hypothetical protein